MTVNLLLLAIALLAAATIGGYFLYCRSALMKRKLYALEQLAQFTQGQAGCRGLTPGFRGVLDGLPFAVELPKEAATPGVSLLLSVKAATLFQLEMHRGLDVVDLTGAHGQLDFDITDDPNLLAPTYLNDPARRQYIWNFLSTGFSSFTIDKDRVWIIMHNCDLAEDLKPSAIHIQLLALVQLAKDAARRPA